MHEFACTGWSAAREDGTCSAALGPKRVLPRHLPLMTFTTFPAQTRAAAPTTNHDGVKALTRSENLPSPDGPHACAEGGSSAVPDVPRASVVLHMKGSM